LYLQGRFGFSTKQNQLSGALRSERQANEQFNLAPLRRASSKVRISCPVSVPEDRTKSQLPESYLGT
jgi:hypothetical protein